MTSMPAASALSIGSFCHVPRSFVMPIRVFSSACVAGLPSATITRGWMIEICRTR